MVWVLRFCPRDTTVTHEWELTLGQAQLLASRGGLAAKETEYAAMEEYEGRVVVYSTDPYWDSLLQGKEGINSTPWVITYTGEYELQLIAPDGDMRILYIGGQDNE